VATTIGNLGVMLLEARGPEAAEPLVREALAIRRKSLADHPDTANSLTSLGQTLGRLGEYDEGIELLSEGLEMHRRFLGDDHPTVGSALVGLAWLQRWAGRLDEAEARFRQAIALFRGQGLESRRGLAGALSGLARLLAAQGEVAEAEALFQESCAIDDAVYGLHHWSSSYCRVLQGAFLSSQARFEEAEALLLRAYPIVVESLGEDHERSVKAREHLTALYEAWGRPAEAARYRDPPEGSPSP